MYETFSDKRISFNLLLPSNADSPIDTLKPFPLLSFIVTFSNDVQLAKAKRPIVVTVSGISIETIEELFRNAPFSIPLTILSPNFTGIFTFNSVPLYFVIEAVPFLIVYT